MNLIYSVVHEVLRRRFRGAGIRRGIEDGIGRVVEIGIRRAAGIGIGKGAGTRGEIEIETGIVTESETVTERGNGLIDQRGEEEGVMTMVPGTCVMIGSVIR